MPKIIRIKIISWYHDNLQIGHFRINNTLELINEKYYWKTLWQDIKAYIKDCNVCLALKTVKYKSYNDLQSLLILTYW